MPSTVNGIGTHYYGKKNLQKRPGPCPHCGRAVELTSYNTRLWFVVFFIPVFPLHRKRIIDYCSACTRHYAVDLQKWETARQLEVSGAMEEFRARPTPEAAIAAHAQLVNFHQTAQADEFRKQMLEQYGGNAKVQAYLGVSLERLGQFGPAAEHYQRALELRPDLPEARIGVAMNHLRNGRPEQARPLLDFLEKPGAEQLYSLEPLEHLAVAFQKANRHAEALELFSRLVTALPNLGEVKGFRELVKKSESALGSKQSVLPKLKFSWKRLLGTGRVGSASVVPRISWKAVGIIVGLILLGFAIANEYIRRHRTLYVVNAFSQPAVVKLSNGETVHVRRLSEVALSEGHYRALISGPVSEQIEFDMRASYFSRWFSGPAWVLNVGGAALLRFDTIVYSRNPPPGTVSFRFGHNFEYFPEATHPFKDLPDSIRMHENESRTLTHVSMQSDKGAVAMEYLLMERQPIEALRLAETWLRTHPADREVLRRYADEARVVRQTTRLDGFLRAGLTNRPVAIEWHRQYQRLHDNQRDIAALLQEYDNLLTSDPTNSALIYLRARLEPDAARRRTGFQQAAADPKNLYARYALAYEKITCGDWAGASTLLEPLAKAEPDEAAWSQWLVLARLASGEATLVEQEMRQRLRRQPLDMVAEVNLLDALAAQGKRDEATAARRDFEGQLRATTRGQLDESAKFLQRRLLYAFGDFAGLEKLVTGDKSAGGRGALVQALLEQGRVEEAAKLIDSGQDAEERGSLLLAFSVASGLNRDEAGARSWRERALKTMEAASMDNVQAARLLERDTPPTTAECDNLVLPPYDKALVLAALYQRHHQPELAAAAQRQNVSRGFPYFLVQRATGIATPER